MINTLRETITPDTRGAVDWVEANPELVGWIMLGLVIGMLVVAMLTMSVQKAFQEKNREFALKQNSTQKTGAQIAQEMLAKNGITNVKVIAGVEGQDHFNPQTGVVSLSPSTYNSSSVSAMAIAAHEVGHAIQWHKKSIMLRVRNVMTAPVQIAAGVGQSMMAFGGLLMILVAGVSFWWFWLTIAGLITYLAMGLFQLVTLPLEYNASRRAMKNLKEMGMLNSTEEIKGAKGVLRAAANTYLIAFIATMITLAYFILRLLLILANNRD